MILFASLEHTKDAAQASIELWKFQINGDRIWAARTFALAYEKVKSSGLEDFSNAPGPGSPNSFIPTSHDRSRQTAASTYANEACRHFDVTRPFLSRVVWSSPGVPSDTIFRDVRSWHLKNPNYPPTRAIEIAAIQIKGGLNPRVPRVVYLSRAAVLVLFLLMQCLPSGVIGWAGYRALSGSK